MKFEDYELYRAIHSVYIEFEKNNLKPRSADWLIFKEKRRKLRQLVIEACQDDGFYGEEIILKAWDDFGKNKEKYKLLIAVAQQFGTKCFYEHRGLGKCSNIMSMERLPLARALRNEAMSVENCIIVCKKHNSDRHDLQTQKLRV